MLRKARHPKLTVILLIDANQQDREYFGQLLLNSSPDFIVFNSTTGEHGLTLFRQKPIDCVVLEIDLPDMSGFEVLRRLIPSVEYPGIPVIILTRLSNHYLLDAAIKNGAQAALYKGNASADILNRAILNAISTVQSNRQPLAV